jgi:PmbA protein
VSGSAELVAELVASALKAGADAADAVFVGGVSVSVSVRNGRTDSVERAEGQDVGLRAFVGKRAAIVSASSLDPRLFRQLAERAVAMARVVPEDRFAGLSGERGAFDRSALSALDLDDGVEPDVASLTTRALSAEEAALAVEGVTQSGEAAAGYGRNEIVLATSDGFVGSYARSGHSVSASALAGTGTGMQRDYDYHSTVHLSDLDEASVIGRRAGERAVARLNPMKSRTGTMPVVWDPRVAGSLIGHLVGAVNGSAVARGTSFLKDRLGERIMPRGVHVIDDPRRVRGTRSRPFDGEGVETRPLAIVEDGVLASWVLDGRSGRQLGLASTGHASRGTSGPPSPSTTNLTLSAGSVSVNDLIGDIVEGIYVTEMMGSAVSGITGDYSRGASGFMIRNGALAEPVAEITVAGNLLDMFARMVPADDLVLRRGVDSPTVRIDGLTVAGA